MFGQSGATGIMGTEAMVTVTRSGGWLTPNKGSKAEPVEFLWGGATPGQPPAPPQPSEHWKNFLECIKTRQKPTSDIGRRGNFDCTDRRAPMTSGNRQEWNRSRLR